VHSFGGPNDPKSRLLSVVRFAVTFGVYESEKQYEEDNWFEHFARYFRRIDGLHQHGK
jgi:hypothetical protein